MSRKRRNNSASLIFSTIQELDSEDERRSKKSKHSGNEAKTKAAQGQTRLYKHLMECRILMQPQLNKQAIAHRDDRDELEVCNDVLSNLLAARQKLLLGDNDATNDNKYKELVEQSDEQELQEVLEEEYNVCREEWKEVLNRRHDDLKLHAGVTSKTQFKVMDSNFWDQVTSTASHDVMRNHQKESDSIFQDEKLYQHMLQDFLSCAGGGESAQQSHRRVMQNSKRQGVDRRATKGRKIRFSVHPKIVNFTFPIQRLTKSSMDEEEWFSSLFGGAHRKSDTSTNKEN